ncbi:hypothetical protein VNO77_11572 [Canavalia gladiata]|uniref:DUF7086 domain-containing protein n=1 Tax=Canavalia gladiata TaxID=3824 RepID=A0AAN9MBL9_CANGL
MERENKRKKFEEEDESDLVLTLALSSYHSVQSRQQNPQPKEDNVNTSPCTMVPYTASTDTNPNTRRVRKVDVKIGTKVVRSRSGRNRGSLAKGKSETIPPPFPWATDRRASIHSYKYLVENNILTITGNVYCKSCTKKYEMGFNLSEKLTDLCIFIRNNHETMHDRAPKVWRDPVFPNCEYCGHENSVRPSLADTKKKEINWLFLLLGQMIGCCTLEQLKYFCKYSFSHRTAAKDRLLYSTYMDLCKQLIPEWFI